LSDFTNKRTKWETKHLNVWKELSNLSPPELAAKAKVSEIAVVNRLKKLLEDSKFKNIRRFLFYFIQGLHTVGVN
jgi:DNA-binding Lrp family transcriptional regulator